MFKARTFKMTVANLWIVRQVHSLDILYLFLFQWIIFQETIKTCTLFSVLPERVVTASNSYTIWHFYRIIIVKNIIFYCIRQLWSTSLSFCLFFFHSLLFFVSRIFYMFLSDVMNIKLVYKEPLFTDVQTFFSSKNIFLE